MPFMKHCPLRNRQFLPAGHDILIYMEKIKENTIVYKKTANGSPSVFECGRWDLNPHERNAHKILSLARLPVPTLPQTTSSFLDARLIITKQITLVNTILKNILMFQNKKNACNPAVSPTVLWKIHIAA